MNCSDDLDYQVNRSQFKTRLEARGYDRHTIHETFGNIPDRQRILDTVILQQRAEHIEDTRTNTIGVPFIITYCPAVRDALPAIKAALDLDDVAPTFHIYLETGRYHSSAADVAQRYVKSSHLARINKQPT